MKSPIFLLLTAFIISFSVFSQEREAKREDTIAIIKEIQRKSHEAIKLQQLEEVVTNLQYAKSLAEKINSPELKSLTSSTLAYFYYSIYNYELAIMECARSISYVKDKTSSRELALAYNLYGLISIHTQNYEQAQRFLDRADQMFISLNDEGEGAKVKYNKGLLAFENNDYSVALNYFTASEPVFQTLNMSYYSALSNLHIAKSLIELPGDNASRTENIEEGKQAVEKAYEISDENKYFKIKTYCYKTLSDIALLQNRHEEAYYYLADYVEKRDSLEALHTKILNKNFNFEANNADLNAIIASQQDNIAQQQKSITMNRFTTGLSVALITILSLLALSLFKNNNLRAKANNLLQEKNSELIIAKERAEKASLAKAQFLSTITHELRTPMYAVTGLTHLLLEENPREDQKEHLNSLQFSGDYLLSLINNILDLNKLEANKVEIEKKAFNLKKRVEDVLIALKKSSTDKNNKLTLDYDDTIPNKLMGDSVVISQILINLVGNSLKFTENGEVVVKIKKLSQTDKIALLHFEVQDSGVGISLKKQKSIFENFTQGSIQINRKYGGTGLGLSIVKNLLSLMDSKINLESEIGKGSTFWFDLKIPIAPDAEESKNAQKIVYGVDYLELEGLKILVVEDNKINQMITKKILEKNKMVCSVADNGEDAVQMVKDNDYDIILMDIHMPGISGIEATQQIREFKKHIPIIALTAVTIDENLDDFYKAGFNDIIPKPFKTEDFFEKIYRTISTQKA